jgi:hypothetical protein
MTIFCFQAGTVSAEVAPDLHLALSLDRFKFHLTGDGREIIFESIQVRICFAQ